MFFKEMLEESKQREFFKTLGKTDEDIDWFLKKVEEAKGIKKEISKDDLIYALCEASAVIYGARALHDPDLELFKLMVLKSIFGKDENEEEESND